MSKGGISKTVFTGVIISEAITQIATGDPKPENKIYYCLILAGLLLCYWGKQTLLDYMGVKQGFEE